VRAVARSPSSLRGARRWISPDPVTAARRFIVRATLMLQRNNRVNPMDTLAKQRFPAPLDNPADDVILALTHALARAIELIPDSASRLAACARAMREVVETRVDHLRCVRRWRGCRPCGKAGARPAHTRAWNVPTLSVVPH
jgi:hypothetical protein